MSKRAIVTGGAGFIGSHVADALLADGYEVHVIDDLSSGAAERVPAQAELIELDIVDAAALRQVFDRIAPQAVFHLAAQASVVASVQDPGRDCDVNVRGTLNVLEAAGAHGAPVVFTSTGGALYGDAAPRPTPEDRIPAPLSPYGASKWAAEAYVRTWALSAGIPHTVTPARQRLRPAPEPARRGRGRRDLHRRDQRGPGADALRARQADARLHLRRRRRRGAAACVAAPPASSTSPPARKPTCWGSGAAWQRPPASSIEPKLADLRPGELQHSCLDISRAEAELGWSPKVHIDEGLAMTYRALSERIRRG